MMMRKIFLLFLASVLLVGCGTKENPADNNNNDNQPTQEDIQTEKDLNNTENEPTGFAFKQKDVTIFMNMDVEPVIKDLGEAMHYFESESCAFKGLDKYYTYGGFEISTYPLDEKDYVSTIDLMDDSVSTPEGIYLGSTVDDMIAAYGDDYIESSGSYTYVNDDSKLQFVTTDDEIIGITYLAVVEGLE